MGSLGTFGAAVREFEPDGERDTFEFFGETFTVVDVIPGMVALQIGAALSGKISDLDGDAAVWEVLRCSLTRPPREADGKPVRADASQFERLHALAIRNRCDSESLVRLALALLEADGGRPTGQQSTSSPGPLPTSTNSSSSASDSPDSPRSHPAGEA
jgi:hypothetical protein